MNKAEQTNKWTRGLASGLQAHHGQRVVAAGQEHKEVSDAAEDEAAGGDDALRVQRACVGERWGSGKVVDAVRQAECGRGVGGGGALGVQLAPCVQMQGVCWG